MCLYYQDNPDAAFHHFQQVLRLAPDHHKARQVYKVTVNFIILLCFNIFVSGFCLSLWRGVQLLLKKCRQILHKVSWYHALFTSSSASLTFSSSVQFLTESSLHLSLMSSRKLLYIHMIAQICYYGKKIFTFAFSPASWKMTFGTWNKFSFCRMLLFQFPNLELMYKDLYILLLLYSFNQSSRHQSISFSLSLSVSLSVIIPTRHIGVSRVTSTVHVYS